MAYQMAPTTVTLNDLEGHSPVARLFSAIRRPFAQHFTRFQLTVCSRGPSAIAGLLVCNIVIKEQTYRMPGMTFRLF